MPCEMEWLTSIGSQVNDLRLEGDTVTLGFSLMRSFYLMGDALQTPKSLHARDGKLLTLHRHQDSAT